MIGRSISLLSSRRSSPRKQANGRNRILRSELLEPRTLLSVSSWSLAMGIHPRTVGGRAAAVVTNAAPKIAQAISVNGNAAITGTSASLSVLGSDDGGESNLLYTWSVTSAPAGGYAGVNLNGTNAAKYVTATFTKAGTYNFTVRVTDAGGLSATSTKTVVVSQTLTGIRLSAPNGQVVSPAAPLTVSGVSQMLAAQGIDQFGNALTNSPAFTWSITASPTAAPQVRVSSYGGSATLTFGKAGAYGLSVQARAGNVSVTSSAYLSVVQVISALRNNSTAPVPVSGTSVQLAVPTFVDQFGSAFATAPALTWSTSSMPQGAAAPVFTTVGSVTTATFGIAGTYYLTGRVVNNPSVSFVDVIAVNQTLTRIVVTPNTASVAQGCDQQFAAQGLDQFGRALTTQPTFTWSASAGVITATGRFTAPTSAGTSAVTARNGTVAGTATVTIQGGSGSPYQNAALGSLVQSLDADGSISRLDMIQLLRSVGGDGVVDTGEFSDLKLILTQATTLNIPTYVRVLAGDVVNGNVANAHFQGQTLGNLTAGSSATQLNKLVDKWFLGADHPTLCNTSLVYRSAAGSLFPRTPSHNDELQGQLGDCYFISALGTLADSNPAAVQNMFIDNGDGTFTVRFYTGTYGTIYNYSDGSISAGFTNNLGTADYVTVDRMLPASTYGTLAYAGYGTNCSTTTNSLWIPLAEKAYAQWNETGKEGRDGLNAYASIEGGWMATVDAQVLGHNATDYIMTSTSKTVAINALASHKAVTIGTLSWSGTNLGLYGNHAYAIVGYNSTTDTFTLYNPWGSNQPGQLTWAQLQATTSQMAVADTSGTVAFGGVTVKSASVRAALSDRLFDLLATMSPSTSAANRASQFPAPTSATLELFDTLASNRETPSPTARFTGSVHGSSSASPVDAAFASDGLVP